MLLKGKLHSSQLYIPKDILAKLALGRESEVLLEFDEKRNALIITPTQRLPISKDWFLNVLNNPPETLEGNVDEETKEYEYDDI
jgi:antitoxin component of MazEF toxin-antitoxin module